VLWTGLGSALEHDFAVVSALALRLAWILGELAAAAAIWPFFRRRADEP
jgi:predicted outer membrane lipoprotein